MKFFKIFLLSLIFVAASQISFAQNIQEETQMPENWLGKYGVYFPFLVERYDRYSKEDVAKFREKLDLLQNAKFDEWEGIYLDDLSQLAYSEFRWKSDTGFVNFYVYTCFPELRHLNYGKIINSPETIQTSPEFAGDSPRKQTAVKYVKVKWGERYYLVEESSLASFAEKAVGVYLESKETSDPNYQNWARYWVKGDLEKPLAGLPAFPASYKKFERLPIEARIISVGKRTVEQEKIIGDTHYYNSAWYSVTIDAGKNRNVKIGMVFDIPELKNPLTITQVNSKTAVGLISRPIDENKNDECWNENFDKIPCLDIENEMKVKTQIGVFSW